MKRIPSRPVFRLAALAATAVAVCTLAACGGGSDEPQKLSFKVNATEKGTTIAAPKSAEAGIVEITYGNNSIGPADLQLVRVEGEHSSKEVVEGLEKATAGKPYPKWFLAAGGIGLTQPGETVSVSQILQPGNYYAFDTENVSKAKDVPKTEVTGEVSDEELAEGAATVKAAEYVFKAEAPLPSGTNQIRFENVGAQPHHMIASKLVGDATAEDVEKAYKSKKGELPLNQNSIQTTAVIEGGEEQLVSFDLEPGRYAFYCFITDRQGGPPHIAKGMVDEFEVK